MSWKRLSRQTLLDTPFMKLWLDSVELRNGKIIDDYSVVQFPDGVVIVATDAEDNLLLFDEYKYAVDDTVLTCPAGALDGGEDPVTAAARELVEETGYQSTELELLGELYSHPSKLQQKNYIVRAKNAVKISEIQHEETEDIGDLQLVALEELRELRTNGRLNTAYMQAAIAMAFPDKF